MQLDHYLAHCPFLSSKRQVFLAEKMVAIFGNQKISDARTISTKQLTAWKFSPQAIAKLSDWFKKTSEEMLEKKLVETRVRCVSRADEEYPKLLQHIYDPPPVLFMRGSVLKQTAPTLAIVGPRKCTPYGERVTRDFVPELVRAGVTIVSGLAFGIDSIAHDATLQARGTTWAIVGTGPDRDHTYPAEHTQFADEICTQGGTIISEYAPGYEPTTFSFPARNRIIAGCTAGTLLIEAMEKSGALITTSAALEQGREVMTIPHSIYSETSFGPHQLIKQGARMVTSAAEILAAINVTSAEQNMNATVSLPPDSVEAEIYNLLTKEPRHINEIIRASTRERSIIMSTITIMEIKGLIVQVGNLEYAQKH